MQVEADLYLTFQGWGPHSTENMELDELMRWHQIAIERREE